MAMASESERLEAVITHDGMCLSLRCTIDTRHFRMAQAIDSSEFQFGGGVWRLNYLKVMYHTLGLRMCSGVCPSPLHVSVHVESSEEGGTVKVLPRETFFTDDSVEVGRTRDIWEEEEQGILEAVPDFRLRGVLTLIVVLKVEIGGSLPCACQTTKTFKDASVQTRLDACSLSSLDTLSENVSGLQDSDLKPDVELRCEGLTVRAHGALLSVRSPVLATMLRADMEEGRTGIVHIRGMEEDTFRIFLNHLHTGKLESESLSTDAALRLYQAGKMYQVDSLSAICSQILVQNLTADNACDVLVTADNAYDALVTADAHADSHLEEAATRYMLENKIPQPGNDRWEAFGSSHRDLAFKVANRYIKELTDSSEPPRKKHCLLTNFTDRLRELIVH